MSGRSVSNDLQSAPPITRYNALTVDGALMVP
jgi:hypothetical protein